MNSILELFPWCIFFSSLYFHLFLYSSFLFSNNQIFLILKKEMQIQLQRKFCFKKGNANWIAIQIQFWKRKCKLNCKANSVLKKEFIIELQSKFCYEKGISNWIANQILFWKSKCELNCKANSVLKMEMQIELWIPFWKRKCKFNCKANYVLKKEVLMELQGKSCFEKGNANWIAKQILFC